MKWDSLRWGEFFWDESINIQYIVNGVAVNGAFLSITDLLTKEANTCSFEYVDIYANKPVEGQEVIINYSDTNGVATKIFHGRITRVEPEKLSKAGTNSQYLFMVECTDWQTDLDKKLVVENYGVQNADLIVKDIITDYTSGFSMDNVLSATEINGIQFNYIYVSECLTQIAERIGWDWYVDYNKDLHFFPVETNDAPIELIDNSEDFDQLNITSDKSQIRNRIYVRGGHYLSNLYTQDDITAVAGQTEFYITHQPFSPFTVTVDGGSPESVGLENIDAAGGHAFLLNAVEKVLKTDTYSFSGGEVVSMSYKYEMPVLAMVEDKASQNAIALIEGGDGVYDSCIVDQNIDTIAKARDRGYAELLKYGTTLIEGSFVSLYPGWKSGQRLHIKLTDRNIDAYYLIREVEINALNPTTLLYNVKFATFSQGFNWLLIKFLDEMKPTIVRTDETLDQLYSIGETVSAGDSTATLEQYTPPFEWGAGGSPQAVWNEFEWG